MQEYMYLLDTLYGCERSTILLDMNKELIPRCWSYLVKAIIIKTWVNFEFCPRITIVIV